MIKFSPALNSISLIISGFLFAVNGYLPILISLGVVIISFLLSMLFIEPISDELEKYKNDIKDKKDAKQIIKIFKIVVEDFKSSVKFIMKSKRLQSLMIFSSIMSGFICILIAYQVNIYEELNISPSLIGIIFAALEIIAAICSKKHDVFQNKFTNKSLTVLGTLAAATCISIGICSCFIQNKIIAIVLITISLAVKYVTVGIYQILIDNYYTNFTNEEIDTKVFSTKLFFNSIANVVLGLIASVLLKVITTGQAFIALGMLFGVLFLISAIYMKNYLGLKPEEYSNEEIFVR